MSTLDRLNGIRQRYDEVNDLIIQPEIASDHERYVRLHKEYKELKPIAEARDQYIQLQTQIEEAKEVISEGGDPEFVEMAEMELSEAKEKLEELEEEIKWMLIPKDPEDSKDAVLEIRAGAGGDEASLFAGDLFRMYQRYVETRGWKMELINANEGTVGGYKEIAVSISGEDVYGVLKYESGVHRVQRVPATESQGRVHTSAASVAVLPEAEEVDVKIEDKDIRRDTFRASGAGGQHVNKTESAIRLTHLPTGIVVECQDGRSQHKNLEQAMKVLRARIYDMEVQKHNDEVAQRRKTLVSTGDRSAKIRTYNFPQGRVTDHRIGLTVHNLTDVLNGDVQQFLDELKMAENTERLKEGTESYG
ncbi:peptide chain release factor 1 [Phaeocystidibacter luteus]|uniref:Peptide chain release factor 1 n=1 Tax=Phaeocystidibacter luteus TaxID=911197 RepID=A0A6N6RK84_9FLAO|nr:peptide chain release factor 1 [Phaeocystidibacter luteus]KAB2809741.1 peptide chain release factor 1 [Phaeocystidibacter luteus]